MALFDLDKSVEQNRSETIKKTVSKALNNSTDATFLKNLSDSAVSTRSGTTVVSVNKALTDSTDSSLPGATKAADFKVLKNSNDSSQPKITKTAVKENLTNSTNPIFSLLKESTIYLLPHVLYD
ncbi:hypothetical protein BpHYR1_002838 [Brachionus plicatilis]|uniref:Uncharacterized protein n=1 Tax=Brachionus plicatilis TaxID=10195 RepID=A0A3M7SDV1_BRAPC|nr:hypothetical protein BpHYR1_002838 [Brachionus plicatilis]